jgi:hypothetical protein
MDDEGLTKIIRPNGIEILRSELDDPDYWPWGPSGPRASRTTRSTAIPNVAGVPIRPPHPPRD